MKIVQVVNMMITNHQKISDVIRNGREYFFIYDKKYKWSMSKSEDVDDYFLHFYPTNDMSIQQLAVFNNWHEYSHFTTYKTNEIKTKEALESFSELYLMLVEKVYGIDEMFDDILNS